MMSVDGGLILSIVILKFIGSFVEAECQTYKNTDHQSKKIFYSGLHITPE